MQNKYLSIKIQPFYSYVILFMGAFFALMATPLAPFANKITNADSNVYIYCAEQILNGKIMYKEVFDHKGPVLYLFNIVGLLIGRGNVTWIWFVELGCLFISLVFIFKSASLYVERFIALLATLSCLFLILLLWERNGGNNTEEYAIPFISTSMYYFLRFLKFNKIRMCHFALIAFCCSGTFLLKPNFLSVWMVGYLFVFGVLLKNSNFKQILSIAMISVAIFIGVCIPFLLYFLYTDSLMDFKFCFWDFNKAYSDTSVLGIITRTVRRFWFAGHFWLSLIGRIHVIIFIIIGILYFKRLKNNLESYFVFCALILTNVMISIGSYDFLNYYMLFVPLFVFLYAAVFHFLTKKLNVHHMVTICLFLLLFSFGCFRQMKATFNKYNPLENLITFIQNNSESSDKIAVVGHDCSIYLFSGRESVSRFAYISPVISGGKLSEIIAENFMEDVNLAKPRIIIITEERYQYLPGLLELLDFEYERFVLTDVRYDCWKRKECKK